MKLPQLLVDCVIFLERNFDRSFPPQDLVKQFYEELCKIVDDSETSETTENQNLVTAASMLLSDGNVFEVNRTIVGVLTHII
jgi:hypothetical protein